MTAYLIISPYGSLNFNDDWRQRDQQSVDYTQTFIAGDAVTVQYAITRGNDQSWTSLNIRHYNLDTGESIPVASSQVEQTDAYTFYNATIDASTAGCFGVAFELTDGEGNVTVVKESVFQVLADYPTEDDDQLMLFRYTNAEQKDNTVFASDFSFRCEAAFFPQNEAYNVEDNNFRDQAFDLSKLSAEASTTRGLTVGGRLGVPTWVAEKLSRIFSCTEVYVGEIDDAVEYVMVDSGAVERTNMGEMYPKYVFSLNLERTLTSANSVRIGTISPIVNFNISPTWLEFAWDYNIVLNEILVEAPDNNWTFSLPNNAGFVTMYKDPLPLSSRVLFSISTNDTGVDRTQEVVFSWTDPDTNETVARSATINQAKQDEVVGVIQLSGDVFDADTGQPVGGFVTIASGSTGISSSIIDGYGRYSYSWTISQSQYESFSKLEAILSPFDHKSQTMTITPLPSFSYAVRNGLYFPTARLNKL